MLLVEKKHTKFYKHADVRAHKMRTATRSGGKNLTHHYYCYYFSFLFHFFFDVVRFSLGFFFTRSAHSHSTHICYAGFCVVPFRSLAHYSKNGFIRNVAAHTEKTGHIGYLLQFLQILYAVFHTVAVRCFLSLSLFVTQFFFHRQNFTQFNPFSAIFILLRPNYV